MMHHIVNSIIFYLKPRIGYQFECYKLFDEIDSTYNLNHKSDDHIFIDKHTAFENFKQFIIDEVEAFGDKTLILETKKKMDKYYQTGMYTFTTPMIGIDDQDRTVFVNLQFSIRQVSIS